MVVLHQLSRKHYTALDPIRRSAILLATALIVLHGCSTPNQTVRHEPRSRHGDPPSFTRFWAGIIVSWMTSPALSREASPRLVVRKDMPWTQDVQW